MAMKKYAKKKVTPLIEAKKPFGSKSAFVRGLPGDMPAREVVERAKRDGMTLSIAQVYNIRSVGKRQSKSPAEKRSDPARARQSTSGGSDDRLRKLIAEIGLARSREVMAEVSAAFKS